MILDCMEMAVDHNLGKMILYDPVWNGLCVCVSPHYFLIVVMGMWLLFYKEPKYPVNRNV